ncbi:MAG: hypothetical protein CMA12_08655 [Euryarchaeota archaeon]|nr:hypothetical protein [Euryarchaeota archaeon]|tara:strand:- start:32 stop:436 length:405 start_codon:yes stop_codon:yes gene_type:complete
MIDTQAKLKIETSSNKSFGIIFSILFLIIFLYLYFYQKYEAYYFIFFSTFLFIISFLKSELLHYPNIIWLKFGLFLGKIFSPIIMFLIYVFLFVTTGSILKLLKKDIIDKKINFHKKSYWKKREYEMQDMKNQY